jgi:predicted Ser/Thr protein kinase
MEQKKGFLLLHGPVGSAKSSIARLLKKGLEHYSRTDDGAIYTYEWFDDEASEILVVLSYFQAQCTKIHLSLFQLK